MRASFRLLSSLHGDADLNRLRTFDHPYFRSTFPVHITVSLQTIHFCEGSSANEGLVAILAFCLLVACGAKTEAVVLNPTAQQCPAISPDSVRVFATQAELDNLKVPYVTMATLHTRYVGMQRNVEEKVVKSERDKAAEIGANGIVLPRFAGASVIAVHYGQPCDKQP